MTAKTGLLIDLALLIQAGSIAEDVQAQLRRMAAADVRLALVSQDPPAVAEAAFAQLSADADIPVIEVFALPSEDADKWLWPKAPQLLRACMQVQIDIFSSWIISGNHLAFKAASQAGLLGGIYVGDDMPDSRLGLQVLNQADSIADAPRVMIPPQGGCWHDK